MREMGKKRNGIEMDFSKEAAKEKNIMVGRGKEGKERDDEEEKWLRGRRKSY